MTDSTEPRHAPGEACAQDSLLEGDPPCPICGEPTVMCAECGEKLRQANELLESGADRAEIRSVFRASTGEKEPDWKGRYRGLGDVEVGSPIHQENDDG